MVFEKLSKAFKKLSSSAKEHTFHIFSGYSLNNKLERMKDEGKISEFESKVSRIQKHHYRIELKLTMTEEQTKKGFSNLVEIPRKFVGGDT